MNGTSAIADIKGNMQNAKYFMFMLKDITPKKYTSLKT
jgi:hypothetical protein